MLVTLGAFRAAEISRDNYRLYIALNYLCYLGFGAHSLFIPLFFWIGVPELAIFNIFSALLWALAYFLNHAAHHREAVIFAAIESVVHAALATYYLGWDSGFHYYFMSIILFLFINHKQNILTIIFEASLVFIGYIWLLNYTHQADFVVGAPLAILDGLLYMNIAVNFSAFGIIGYFFRIASTRAEQQMELLATTDTLTGLFNRRKMLELIGQEVIRYQRDKKLFLLVITDIDHFKKFNDDYGHDCGDYVLQQVSQLMKESLRQQDVVARWGGEEFLIMLPETEMEGGIQAIEKLRETLANRVYQYADNTFSVTMTFGVTAYDGSCDVDTCIKRADEVLYAGKRGGRNRVVSTLGS